MRNGTVNTEGRLPCRSFSALPTLACQPSGLTCRNSSWTTAPFQLAVPHSTSVVHFSHPPARARRPARPHSSSLQTKLVYHHSAMIRAFYRGARDVFSLAWSVVRWQGAGRKIVAVP
jgi:hypothetical protein